MDKLTDYIAKNHLALSAALLDLALLIGLRSTNLNVTQYGQILWEFLLTLLGVIVGLLLMPTLTSQVSTFLDVINAEPKFISALNDDQVIHRLNGLLAARFPSDTADLITAAAIRPLIEAYGGGRFEIRRNVTYDIRLGRLADEDLIRVTSTLTCQLALPKAPFIYLAFADNYDALSEEFNVPGCIHRELTPNPKSAQCHVEINAVRLREHRREDSHGLSRRFYKLPELRHQKEQPTLQVGAVFDMAGSANSFPIFFSDYFCTGTTRIGVQSTSIDSQVMAADVFFAGSHQDRSLYGPVSVESSSSGTVSYVQIYTPSDVLIWPGSGAIISWPTAATPEEGIFA